MLGGFGLVDWIVVFGLLALTTLVAHRASGKPATIRDYFLAGRKLPWYAVSASIVATEISAVTFVSLPFVVFKEGGDLTYLQLGVFGALVARLIVAFVLVPAYYEREIFSPYDYMGERLGPGVKRVTTVLFSIGGVLAQSCRVYLTAVVLQVILADELAWVAAHTGIGPLAASVIAIGVVAVLWTWMGGIATVVWTDAILFLVFLAGLGIAFTTAVRGVDGGLGEVFSAASEARKLRFFDFSTDPTKAYTMWAALIGASWMMTGIYGTDQLMAQRMFCCKGPREAKRAILGSYVGLVVTVFAAFVGLGLFAYYGQHPLEGEALALYEEKGDRIFPIFTLQALPVGLKGVVLSGVFAAAISSLDSILAALSQATLSSVYLPLRRKVVGETSSDAEERRSLVVSRVFVLVFGVLLCAVAIGVESLHERYPSILDLALAMATYTAGALLAGFLLAFFKSLRVDGSGYVWSAPISVLGVFAVVWHTGWARWTVGLFALVVVVLWFARRFRGARDLVPTAALFTVLALVWGLCTRGTFEGADGPVNLAWPWNVPIGCGIAFVWGILLARRTPTTESTHHA